MIGHSVIALIPKGDFILLAELSPDVKAVPSPIK